MLDTCKAYFTPWTNTSPNGVLFSKATFVFFTLMTFLCLGLMSCSTAQFSLCSSNLLIVSIVWNPLKPILLCGEYWCVWKCLIFTSRKKPTMSNSSFIYLMWISQTPQNKKFDACKVCFTQWMNTSLHGCLLWKTTLAFFPPSLILYLREWTNPQPNALCTLLVYRRVQ